LIKDFDLKKMPAECFGGKDSEHNSDYWSKGDNSSTNAYMLVYEKTRKNPMAIQFASLQEKIDVLTTLTLDSVSSSEDLNATLGYDHFPRIVPADLYKAAWLDNH
jgi:ubiquitin carboxyl-terminal hydrolase 9/24